MKKSTTIIILISLVTLLVICVVANIITVADKVSQLSPWLGYAFYGVLLLLTAALIVWPAVVAMGIKNGILGIKNIF